jgi:hypothetical protein
LANARALHRYWEWFLWHALPFLCA